MVSLAYLITLLSAFVAVSVADEVSGGKEESVDAKWFGRWGGLYSGMGWGLGGGWLGGWGAGLYGGCYAYTLLGGMYNGLLFAKATDAGTSISRRAITLDSDHLFRRAADNQHVQCMNQKGENHSFSTSECLE